jgi:hypothetical protein
MQRQTELHYRPGCPFALYRIHIDPVVMSVEACDFWQRHQEIHSPHSPRLMKHDDPTSPGRAPESAV